MKLRFHTARFFFNRSGINLHTATGAGGEKAVLPSLEFTFKPASGSSITLKGGLTNVPVQRNWRTNILGQLLSSGKVSFNISIDPIYINNYNYPTGSTQELAWAAAYGGTVTLQENVVLEETLAIAEGKSVTVDLNGYTISNTTDIWNTTVNDWSLFSVRGGTLTITGDGTVQAKENDCYAVDVQDGVTIATDDASLASAMQDGAQIALLKGATYTFDSNEVSADGVTISGNGASIDASTTAKISGDNVTISSVTVIGSNTSVAGGSLEIMGSNTRLSDITFTDGRTATYSGDVVIRVTDANSVTTIENCDFTNSGFRGILIYNLAGSLVINNCDFDNTYPFNANLTSDTGSILVTNSVLKGWTSYGALSGGCFFHQLFLWEEHLRIRILPPVC